LLMIQRIRPLVKGKVGIPQRTPDAARRGERVSDAAPSPAPHCTGTAVAGICYEDMELHEKNKWSGLILWLLAVAAVSTFGSLFMPGEWYRALAKPSLTPPSWVFGPVWTVLYILMAIAAWLVWLRFGFRGARIALALFITQLVMNGLWSWLFFGLHWMGIATLEIVLLLVTIVATIVAFFKLRPMAAYLLLPYVLWVGYASLLTFLLWRMNT